MQSRVDTALEKVEDKLDTKTRERINKSDQDKWLKLMKPFAKNGKVTLDAFTKAVEQFIT